MTIREMVTTAGALEHVAVQFLNDCIQNVQSVGKRANRYSKVTFSTNAITPDDVFWLTLSEADRAKRQRPKFVGVIVWIPTEDYDRMAAAESEHK